MREFNFLVRVPELKRRERKDKKKNFDFTSIPFVIYKICYIFRAFKSFVLIKSFLIYFLFKSSRF